MAVDTLKVKRLLANTVSAQYGPIYLDDVGRRMADPYGQKLGQDCYVEHDSEVTLYFTGAVALSSARGTIKVLEDAGLVETEFIPG